MPIVRMPDGTQVRFPDEMPQEQIKGLIAQKFPQVAPQPNKDEAFPDLPVPGSDFNPEQGQRYQDGNFAQITSGINEGLANTLGAPVDLTNLAIGGIKNLANDKLGTNFQTSDNPFLGAQHIKEMMGNSIVPETDNGGQKFMRRVAQEVGASVLPGMHVAQKAQNFGRSMVNQAVAATGAGAGAATAQAIAPDNPYAELAGQILGGMSAVGAQVGAKKILTPNKTSPERLASVKRLADEGIDLTAGQKTDNRRLKYLEAELGGKKAQDVMEKQAEQFTSAALQKAGISAKRATSEVMNEAFDAIGNEFGRLASKHQIAPDRQMGQELANILDDYHVNVAASQRSPIVQKVITDIVDEIQKNRHVSGKFYQNLRSQLMKKSVSGSDVEKSQALRDIANALDDAMERTLQRIGSPDYTDWTQVRQDYRNMIAIEDAVSKAGEKAVNGLITPANLRTAVAKQGKRAYARGRGDLNQLARDGVTTMSPLPDSGTASRLGARFMNSAPSLLGGLAGQTLTNDISGALLGGMAGAAAPRAMGAAIMSGVGQKYLANNLLDAPLFLPSDVQGAVIGGSAQFPRNRKEKPISLLD